VRSDLGLAGGSRSSPSRVALSVAARGGSELVDVVVATFNSQGRGELIELLLEHGADSDLVNQHGQTPRGLAKLIGNYDVEQFFGD
jgi:ankyrin repeat protein